MSRGTMPKLVIFDCDGVLVDSEPISLSVMLGVLGEAGCAISERDGYENLLGKSLASNAEWIREARGFDLTPTLLEALRARLYTRFRAELEPISGIAETLGDLPCPFCVASSSQPERVRLSLDVTGLIDRFEPNIFSASMVKNGKPAPDLFLLAAQRMGVDPADCLVVEDSPAGIAAAQAAGMAVVGFIGGSHAEPAGLADKVAFAAPNAIISSMADLATHLRVTG